MATVANEIKMGHNATIAHQRAIADLIVGLRALYLAHAIDLEALPETDIDPGNPESKCPDLVLRDNLSFTVPIIIEVTTNFGYKTDLLKAKKLIDETAFGIEEAFIYNFESDTWYKYSKKGGIAEVQRSFSDILQLDLSQFIQPAR
ncbi:MAG: hypothetical protein HUU34_18960 [Saprospiraceae bacterium]|jgi:hypothetical protein|nr:hypothetical protein [Saprospiraceae bacterium]